MSKYKFLSFLIIAGSILLAKTSIIDNLYQIKAYDHVNLLKASPYWQSDKSSTKISLNELLYSGNKDTFLSIISKKLEKGEPINNNLLAHYVILQYSKKEDQRVQKVLPLINRKKLSAFLSNSLFVIDAVYKYNQSDLDSLEQSYYSLVNANYLNKKQLFMLQDMLNVLRIKKLNKLSFDYTLPAKKEYRLLVGWNNLADGKYKQAIKHFNNSNIKQKNKALFGKAVALQMLGEFEKSKAIFETLETDSPILEQETSFRKLEGNFYLNEYKNCLTEITKYRFNYGSKTIYEKQIKWMETLSLYYTDKMPQAIACLKPLLDKNPLSGYYLGEIYYNQGHFNKTIIYYQKTLDFIKNNPQYTTVKYASLSGIAWSYFKTEKYNQAKEIYIKLQKELPNDHKLEIETLLKIADCNYNLRLYQNALDTYISILKKEVKDKKILEITYLNIATILNKMKKYKQSIKYYELYEITVDDPVKIYHARQMNAENYAKLEQYSKAAGLLDNLLKRYEVKSEEIYINLADYYYNAAQYKNATKAYRLYLTTFTSGNKELDARYGLVQSLFQQKNYKKALNEAEYVDKLFKVDLVLEIKEKLKFIKKKKGK